MTLSHFSKTMSLLERNIQQIADACGEVNRYYFGITNGRQPKGSDELILYYCENGGALGFAMRLREYERQHEPQQ